jgi:catalase
VSKLRQALKKEGAQLKLVAPKIGKLKGNGLVPDMQLDGAPSVLFDAVVALPSEEGAEALIDIAGAIDWLRDADAHLKAIGFNAAAEAMLEKAGISSDPELGIVSLDGGGGVEAFIAAARKHKIWEREKLMHPPR